MARGAALPTFPWPSSWEYRDVSLEYDGSWAEELDKLGSVGWMVISVIHDESVKGDKEIRVILMRPKNEIGRSASSEGRVTKRKSKTAETGHEIVEDEESDEEA